MIKCQFFLVVNDSTFVYTGYEFYPLYGSLLTLKGDKDSKYTFDTRGVDAYERGGDARRLALGCKFRFWSHLGYSGQNAIIYKVSFRVAREKI